MFMLNLQARQKCGCMCDVSKKHVWLKLFVICFVCVCVCVCVCNTIFSKTADNADLFLVMCHEKGNKTLPSNNNLSLSKKICF